MIAMNTYDELFCLICESKMLNDDNEFEYFIESKLGDQVLKVSRAKFLKDHDYDKETKTIKLSGQRYKINPGFSSVVKISSIDGTPIYNARVTAADTASDDPKIILDKNFFKIIGKKSKEAVIQHEVGHLRMHSQNPNNKHRDKAFASKNTFADMIKANLAGSGFDKETQREIIKEALKDPNIRKVMQQKSGEISDSDRKRLRDIMKKYSRGGHSSPTELEADRYAANRTSNTALASGVTQYQFHANREQTKTAKKGIRDLEKNLKENPTLKKEYDALTPGGDYLAAIKDSGMKNLSKRKADSRKELVNRIRALHDKDLKKAEIYKRESTDDILDGVLAIYESAYMGEISEKDRDNLLKMVVEATEKGINPFGSMRNYTETQAKEESKKKEIFEKILQDIQKKRDKEIEAVRNKGRDRLSQYRQHAEQYGSEQRRQNKGNYAYDKGMDSVKRGEDALNKQIQEIENRYDRIISGAKENFKNGTFFPPSFSRKK